MKYFIELKKWSDSKEVKLHLENYSFKGQGN